MNPRIIKLIIINIIILNYFNLSLGIELIIPKNKPLLNKSEIELNDINFLLPKKKPILIKEQILTKEYKKTELDKVKSLVEGIIVPLPKPIVVTKIKPPKKSKFYSKKEIA